MQEGRTPWGRPPAKLMNVAPASGGLGAVRDDVDHPTTTPGGELDVAADEREQRGGTTAAPTGAGVEVGAALANDDLAVVDELTTEPLDAEALGGGVATV